MIDRLRDFLRWWTGELAALVPARLRPSAERRRSRLLLDVEATEFRLYGADGSGDEPVRVPRSGGDGGDGGLARRLRPVTAGRARLLLRVPPSQLLQREVKLPAAAAENLAEVLGFEMPRLTPFAAGDVHFEYRVLERRDARGELRVRLTVVRRALLDEVLAALAPVVLRPAGLAESEADVDGVLLELAPPPAEQRGGRLLAPLVWTVNAALLAALVLVPLAREDEALADLERMVAAARTEATAVAAVRERLERLEQRRRHLLDARRDQPSAAEILRELTVILPDTTWARQVEMDAEGVALLGSSESASSLIATIEDSPLFRRASFTSPVTRDPASGREQFRLAFELEPVTVTGDAAR